MNKSELNAFLHELKNVGRGANFGRFSDAIINGVLKAFSRIDDERFRAAFSFIPGIEHDVVFGDVSGLVRGDGFQNHPGRRFVARWRDDSYMSARVVKFVVNACEFTIATAFRECGWNPKNSKMCGANNGNLCLFGTHHSWGFLTKGVEIVDNGKKVFLTSASSLEEDVENLWFGLLNNNRYRDVIYVLGSTDWLARYKFYASSYNTPDSLRFSYLNAATAAAVHKIDEYGAVAHALWFSGASGYGALNSRKNIRNCVLNMSNNEVYDNMLSVKFGPVTSRSTRARFKLYAAGLEEVTKVANTMSLSAITSVEKTDGVQYNLYKSVSANDTVYDHGVTGSTRKRVHIGRDFLAAHTNYYDQHVRTKGPKNNADQVYALNFMFGALYLGYNLCYPESKLCFGPNSVVHHERFSEPDPIKKEQPIKKSGISDRDGDEEIDDPIENNNNDRPIEKVEPKGGGRDNKGGNNNNNRHGGRLDYV